MEIAPELKKAIGQIKEEILREREAVEKIEALVKEEIEREAGIWEYGFDELEEEMWRRFHSLENHSECASEEFRFPPWKGMAPLFLRLKNFFRTLSGPFSRSVIDKKKQFNLDTQDFINREQVPFRLAVILTLQKIKDRLNVLEEVIRKITEEQEELVEEIERKEGK